MTPRIETYQLLKTNYSEANLDRENDLKTLIKQINKDLRQSGYDETLDEELSFEKLIDTLEYYIMIYLDTNSQDVRTLLYRIDVSEKELLSSIELTPLKIVELIIKREIIKIKFRKQHQ